MKLTMPDDVLCQDSKLPSIAELIERNKVEQNPNLVLAKGNVVVTKEAFASIHITHKNFFVSEDACGYASKSAFLAMLYSMSRGELQSLNTLFGLMAEEAIIKVYSSERVNSQGQTTVTCSYEKDEITYILFIRTTGHMHQLLQLYEFSILTCKTSLEELYFEALN